MPLIPRRIQYFNTTVRDQPGEAYNLLHSLADLGINQLAFSAIPNGPNSTQLTVFPEDPQRLIHEAKRSGLALDGPHHALLIQGDDEPGALAEMHQKLFQANINVNAAHGIVDSKGGFGCLIYISEGNIDRAATTLGI